MSRGAGAAHRERAGPPRQFDHPEPARGARKRRPPGAEGSSERHRPTPRVGSSLQLQLIPFFFTDFEFSNLNVLRGGSDDDHDGSEKMTFLERLGAARDARERDYVELKRGESKGGAASDTVTELLEYL